MSLTRPSMTGKTTCDARPTDRPVGGARDRGARGIRYLALHGAAGAPMNTDGLYRKFVVRRVDESPKHSCCDYFVLDWVHDPFAVPAALAYADACEDDFPELATDLRERAASAVRR